MDLRTARTIAATLTEVYLQHGTIECIDMDESIAQVYMALNETDRPQFRKDITDNVWGYDPQYVIDQLTKP